ncbi:MAG: 50S ribosomal protein L13 [Candidatus Aenigmatarchaeota archaeon]
MIINADGLIMGRMAMKVAKLLLNGEQVTIVNCEKAIITGNPKSIVERYTAKRDRGDPNKGPFYPRNPVMLVKRVVRGMLPRRKSRGRDALRKLKVYIGNSDNLQGEKLGKSVDDIKCKFITVRGLCKELGAKIE